MKLRKYDQAQLREAVKNSTSLRQVLEALGVAPYGGNYEVLRRAIQHFSLDTSHFTGQRWNKGKTVGPKQPLQRFLDNEIRIASFKLKKRLLAEGILTPQCSSCGLGEWLSQPIPLELDHINGQSLRQSAPQPAVAMSELSRLDPNVSRQKHYRQA
jgi:hypothetical protein